MTERLNKTALFKLLLLLCKFYIFMELAIGIEPATT